jgi:hypothetical protein
MTTPPAGAEAWYVNAQSLVVGADRFGFTLDPVELSVLRQAYGVRSRLFPLRLANTTVGPVRLAALATAVDDALGQRGLSEEGQHIPPVQTAFELLAEHRLAVSVTGAPGDLTVLAVSDGVRAMVITQRSEEELTFTLFPAAELVGAVVGALPQAKAAAGGPVWVGALGEPTGAQRLSAQLAGPKVGGGLLVASGRGRHGMWTDILGWVDTTSGRHVVSAASDRSGNFSARYAPAGPAELSAAVAELLETER